MRKLLITSYILITCSANLFSQWSNDPNNNLVIGYGLNPELCSDSVGGCYITYEAGYPAELNLHRVDKYGYQPWGDKIIIAGELDEQSNAKIIEDGEGGVIVSYGDRIMFDTYRLRIQKVDSNGNFLWGQTGIWVSVVDTGQSVQRIVSDGNGGCVIVWMESNVGNAEYRINQIDRNGQRVWSDSGIYIQSDYNYSKPRLIRAADGKYYLEIRENIFRISQNGEFTLWEDTSEWRAIVAAPDGGGILHSSIMQGIYNYKLIAQRKDTLGNSLWQEPYVEIADSLDINTPLNIQPINGFYFYNWLGNKNGIELVTQYQALRSDGNKLFNQGSLPISSYPVDASIGNILPSDSGTFVMIWQDYRTSDGVFGQRKDTLGNALWNSNDVPLYTGMYSDLFAITDCMGGAIGLGWHLFDFSIRVFKVSKNGILGEVITNIDHEYQLTFPNELVLYQNFPNPFNSSTIIQFQLPKESEISIELHNVLGEKIQTIVNGFYSKGMHSINFSIEELSSGVYLYKLSTESIFLIKKLIIIK